MLHVPALVSSLHGSPRGENASLQVLSHGVPDDVSVLSTYALGFEPLGAADDAVMCRARSIVIVLPLTKVQGDVLVGIV